MFDCPVQSQTSPNRMFLSTTFCARPSSAGPLLSMVSVCGPPACCGASLVVHLPSGPAVATGATCRPSDFSPSSVTVILSPGVVQPQMGAATSRCNTASSANNGCTSGNRCGCVGHHGCGPT